MKKIVVGVACVLLLLGAAGCGGKSSGLEGKVVDGQNKPMAGLKIVASQEQPIKGYEQFEAVSGSDGSFKFKKLFPSSGYVIKPWSDKWTANVSMAVETAPVGETSVLPRPLVIRYTVSKEGVIADSATGLEWVVGPDQGTHWYAASKWVSGLSVAGGGWRLPTRAELKSLYVKDMRADYKIDPVFNLTGYYVWSGEREGSSSAWDFGFSSGSEHWGDLDGSTRRTGLCGAFPEMMWGI